MTMGKVIFYENRNFTGRSWECNSDCFDMAPHLSRCHSCRVESGCWMLYDHARFTGDGFFIKKGEYSDFWGKWGMDGWIRSCRMIPMHSGSHRMRVYEQGDFMGQMTEMSDDCDSFTDRHSWSHGCGSCHVLHGHWLMYEFPNYTGRMWLFGPGEYRNFSQRWGTRHMRFMSMRRIMDSWY
ncbi:gamma-crystallin M2-like [Brachyhypopomus gauderio]|uniref:gamma-crystallin M2-like n=1 Tax=Brachyhypopomus gauderio TaxID=698409 RepID=UPI0040414561